MAKWICLGPKAADLYDEETLAKIKANIDEARTLSAAKASAVDGESLTILNGKLRRATAQLAGRLEPRSLLAALQSGFNASIANTGCGQVLDETIEAALAAVEPGTETNYRCPKCQRLGVAIHIPAAAE